MHVAIHEVIEQMAALGRKHSLVPFVEEDDYFVLKTVIPSRKATRDYLNQGETDAEN